MNFTPQNAELSNTGRKTQTRRFTDKYQVGKDYANCPGRGKRAIGRILITRKWQEPLQAIDWADAICEGVAPEQPLHDFEELWQSIYKGVPGKDWNDNPIVWCYEYEVFPAQTAGDTPVTGTAGGRVDDTNKESES